MGASGEQHAQHHGIMKISVRNERGYYDEIKIQLG
jgi:hypothetical protein